MLCLPGIEAEPSWLYYGGMMEAPKPPLLPPRGSIPAWAKALIVTGVGCGAVIAVLFAVSMGGMIWLFAPGKQIDTRVIAGKSTEAIFHFKNQEDRSGLSALINRFFVEMQKIQNQVQREQMPESMRWLVDLQSAQNQKSMGAMQMYIPREVTVTVEGSKGEYVRNTFVAVNPSMFSGMIKVMFGIPARFGQDVQRLEHNGHEYVVMKEGSAMCFIGGTILWAQMGEGMPELLDRVDAGAPSGRLGRELEKSMEGQGAWDFFMGLLGGRDLSGWLFAEGGEPRSAAAGPVMAVPLPRISYQGAPEEPVPPEEPEAEPQGEDGPEAEPAPPDDGGGEQSGTLGSLKPDFEALADLGRNLMWLGIFVVSEDKVVGRLFVECGKGKDKEAAAAALQAIKVNLKEKAAPRGLTLTGRVKKEPDGVTMKFQLSGIGQAITDYWLAEFKKKEGERNR